MLNANNLNHAQILLQMKDTTLQTRSFYGVIQQQKEHLMFDGIHIRELLFSGITKTTSETSFLSFFTYESVPILPHEYGGFTSRKIPKPQNLLPRLKNDLLSEDPNSIPPPKKKLLHQFYFKTKFLLLSFRDPQLFNFFKLTILLVANQN